MSKVLAIDYGKKRCGFAISDEDQSIAFPLETAVSYTHLTLPTM